MTTPTPDPGPLGVTWTDQTPTADEGAPITSWQVAALLGAARAKGLSLDRLAALGAERLGLPAEWSALTVGQARALLRLAEAL